MFRRLGLALLGVLGLLLVLSLAAFVGAQTSLGQRLIEAQLGRLLSTPETEVRLEGLSGLVPFDMALGHLAVGPAEAPWLTAAQLRLRWQPTALLDGRLRVDEVGARALTLHDLPPDRDDAQDDGPLRLPELPRWLPLIAIDRLAIEELAVAEAALGEAATFELAGRLTSDAARTVTLDLDLARVDEATAVASVMARLEAAPAVLELTLQVDETGGLLAATTGHPEAGDLHLTLDGRGPIAAWAGRLRAEAAGLGTLEAGFDLALVAAPRLDLDSTLVPAAGLPATLRGLLGERATLALGLTQTGPQQLDVRTLAVTLAAAELTGSAHLDFDTEQLDATAALAIADLASLAPLLELQLSGAGDLRATVHGAMATPSGQLQVTAHDLTFAGLSIAAVEAAVDLVASQPLAGADATLRLTGRGLVSGGRHDALGLPPRDLAVEVSATAALNGPVTVERLQVVSAEVELTGTGQLDPELLEATGQATLEVADLGPLAAAFGAALGGQARLSVTATSSPGAERVGLDLEGNLDQLEGLPEALAAVLGSSVALAGRVDLVEGRRLELTGLEVTAATARLDGRVGLDLGPEQIDGELALALADLGVLAAPLDLALAGSLKTRARLAGSLAAPAFDLAVAGQDLVLAGQPVAALALAATARGALATPAGEVRLTLASRGVETRSSTDYALAGDLLSLDAIALVAPQSRIDGRLEIDLARHLLTGRLTGKAADLIGVAPLLPLPLRGGLSFEAQLTAAGGQQSAQLDLEGRDLRGEFGRIGRLVLAGRLADLLGAPTVEATLTVTDLHQGETLLERGQLRASGPLTELDLEAALAGEATVPFALEGRAQLALAEAITLRLDALTGTVADLPLRLEQPATLTLDGDALRLDGLDLRLAEARAVGSLALDPRAVAASLTLQPTPLALLARFGAPPLDGTAEARLTLRGAPGDPEGSLEITAVDVGLADATFAELPPARLVVTARLAARRLDLELRGDGLTTEPLALTISLPLTLDLHQGVVELPADGRLDGRMAAKMALAQLADIAGLHNDRLEGPLQIDLELGGTVATPVVSGSITVVDGLYEGGASGTVLRELTLRVRADGQHMTIEELSATDGGEGRFSGGGELVLDPARDFPVDIDLRLQRARLVQLDDLTVTASGDVSLRGDATAMALTGTITVDQADAAISAGGALDIPTIEVEEIGGDRPEGAAAASAPSSTILDLDLTIDMPRRVFVRGFGLDSEWKGRLQVTGPMTAPRLAGRLEVHKGYFDLLDRRFDLSRGEILFAGASPPVPMLDIEAVTQTADIRAIVRIHDRATKPKIDFESEPPLPEDEVLSYVLFGEGSSEISAAQAAQLASAANRLTGGGDLLGDLRAGLGIDTLDFNQDATTADAKVRAGKYLSDEVYVEVESGQADQSGRARVEVEILPGVSVQADTGQDQRSGIGLEWRYDY